MGGVHGPGLSAAAGASVASRLPLGLPFAGISGAAGGRRGNNRGCTARCDCARSSVSAVRDGTASARWRLSDGCGVVFPACCFDEPLLIASLSALATVALPGIGGLVILTVVGVRIQYGRLTPDSHREHRALRDSPIPRAVKRWMSAR